MFFSYCVRFSCDLDKLGTRTVHKSVLSFIEFHKNGLGLEK
jgi:hypothetical protein